MWSGPLVRTLSRRALRVVGGILGLIGAIFVAESFTTLLGQVLHHDGSVLMLALLLLLKMPEIVDFALPIALTLGLYFAILGARDDNELVICAAAGLRWTQVPGFAMTVGMAAALVSMCFSAVITPSSSHLMRLAFFQMEVRGITEQLTGTAPAEFQRTIADRTVIATPPRADTGNDAGRGQLFIFTSTPRGGWQFDQADSWNIAGGTTEDNLTVSLQGYRSYSGTPPLADGDSATLAGEGVGPLLVLGDTVVPTRLNVETLSVGVQKADILPALDAARRPHEALFWGAVQARSAPQDTGAVSDDGGDIDAGTWLSPRFAEAFARALVCPFAALIAAAGAAWAATGVGRFIALPVTVITVLAFDVVARGVLASAAAQGATAFWTTTSILSLSAAVLPIIYIWRSGETIMAPRRGRA